MQIWASTETAIDWHIWVPCVIEFLLGERANVKDADQINTRTEAINENKDAEETLHLDPPYNTPRQAAIAGRLRAAVGQDEGSESTPEEGDPFNSQS